MIDNKWLLDVNLDTVNPLQPLPLHRRDKKCPQQDARSGMIDMKDVLFMEISETMEMKFSSYSIIILLDLKTKAEIKKYFLFKLIAVGDDDYSYLLVT